MRREFLHRSPDWIEVKRTIPVPEIQHSSKYIRHRKSVSDTQIVCDQMIAEQSGDLIAELRFSACFQHYKNDTFRVHSDQDIALYPDEILNASSSQWYQLVPVTGSVILDANARIHKNTCMSPNPADALALSNRVSAHVVPQTLTKSVEHHHVRRT